MNKKEVMEAERVERIDWNNILEVQQWLNDSKVIPVTNGNACIDEREVAIPVHFFARRELSSDFIEESLKDREIEISAVLAERTIERTTKDHGNTQIAGGSLGFAMLVQAVTHLDPELVIQYVSEWDKENGRVFSVHTDNHGHGVNASHELRCGHVGKALESPVEYDLTEQEMKGLLEATTLLPKNGVKVKVLTYKNNHLAGAVIDNESLEATIVPRDGIGEVFRTDSGRVKELINNEQTGLTAFLKRKGVNVSSEDLIAKFQKHAQVSLGKLAENKPLYTATINQGIVTLTSKGRITRAA